MSEEDYNRSPLSSIKIDDKEILTNGFNVAMAFNLCLCKKIYYL